MEMDKKVESSMTKDHSSYRASAKEELTHLLKGLEETAKQSRSLLVVLSTACAFVLVAAFSQHGDSPIKLPILGNEVDPSDFFTWSPVVLLFIYLYLQFYIQELRGRFTRLQECLSRVSISPSSLSRDILFPWFFVTALEAKRRAGHRDDQDQFGRSDADRQFAVPFIYPVAAFIVWIMGPAVLGVLWMRFIGKGDPIALIPCVALILSSVVAVRSIHFPVTRIVNGIVVVVSSTFVLLTLASVPVLRDRTYLGYIWQARHAVLLWVEMHLLPFVARSLIVLIPSLVAVFVIRQLFQWFLPLRAYRRALARELRNLSTASGIKLQRIYVPIHGHLRENPNQELSVEEAVRVCKKLLILGHPASGKTTSLTMLALTLAEDSFNGTKYAPIFLRASNLKSSKSLRELAIESIGQYGISNPKAFFSRTAERQRLAILLDGVDEIRGDQFHLLLEEVEKIAYEFKECIFVVTSRPEQDLRLLEGSFGHVFEISPLSKQSVKEMADKYFSDQPVDAKAFWENIGSHESTILLNPFILIQLMRMYEERGFLPKSESDLMEMLIDSRIRITSDSSLSSHQITELLQLIAVNMKYSHSLSIARAHALDLAKQVMHATGDDRSPEEFLYNLYRTGLVTYSDDSIAFTHKAVMDYFSRHS